MNLRSISGVLLAATVLIVGVTVVGGSWYTIDEGERGVVLRNGAVIGEAGPGLNFKLPIIDSVVKVDLRELVQRWICTVDVDGNVIGECNNSDLGVMLAYSKDQQPAALRVSVNYAIPLSDVKQLYTSYQSIENFVSRSLARKAPQAVKQVFGQYNAATAVIERARLSQEALNTLQTMMQDEPVIISALQVENIDYSAAYEQAVEERMLAEVEVAKRNQQWEQEKIQAQIVVTQAQAQADAVKAKADAEAYSIRVQGQATAEAIKSRGQALKDNPLLVELTTAEKWDGVLPTTIPPNGTVPFLNVTPGVVN